MKDGEDESRKSGDVSASSGISSLRMEALLLPKRNISKSKDFHELSQRGLAILARLRD